MVPRWGTHSPHYRVRVPFTFSPHLPPGHAGASYRKTRRQGEEQKSLTPIHWQDRVGLPLHEESREEQVLVRE